jgi:O-antigen/teichoic acid export membrane protein
VAWLALFLDVAIAIAAFAVAASGLGGRVAALLRVPALTPYLTWIAPAVALIGAYSVFTYWAIRKKAYSRLAQSRFVNSIVMAASQLLLALGGHRSSGGLIAGMIAGQLAGAGFLATSTGFRRPAKMKVPAVLEAARRYAHFPKYSAIGSLLDGLSALLPVALLTAAFSPTIGGLFAVADRMMRMPSVLLGSSLTQVFYQKIAESRRDPQRCAAFMLRTWTHLAFFGAVPMLTVVAAGPTIFAFVLGPQWRMSGEYAQILSVGLFVHFVAYPTSNGIVAFERLGIMLTWQLLMIASIVAVFFGSEFLFHDSVRATLWLYSGSLAVVYGASLAAQWHVVRSASQEPASAIAFPAVSEPS